MTKVVHARVQVGPDGNVVVPLGPEAVGKTVHITISPIDEPGFANGISREKWFELFEKTEGCIDDPTFVRPPQPICE